MSVNRRPVIEITSDELTVISPPPWLFFTQACHVTSAGTVAMATVR